MKIRLHKRKVRLALAVCLFVFSSLVWARWRPAERFDPVAPKEGTLRIMTWNVGYFAPIENKNMRTLDVDRVSEVLRVAEAQVVILQELGELQQADAIAAKMGNDWKAYSALTGHGKQVVAVLTALPVVHEENVLCGGRTAKGITVREPDGNLVYVLGVHSPHPGRGMSENLNSIRDSIGHALKREESFRLVGGDLNYNFDEGSPDELYTCIMENFGDGTIGIGETYYAHTRIDHLFHYPKELEVLKEESGMMDLSLRFAEVPGFRDHRPIVVSYQLN